MKQHKWFEGFDWDALAARKIAAPRKPRDDAAKRIRELAVSARAAAWAWNELCVLPGYVQVHGVASVTDATAMLHDCCCPLPNPDLAAGARCLTLPCCYRAPLLPQETERKQRSQPKETPEELAEAEAVFADF